jgi:hypothetical protein
MKKKEIITYVLLGVGVLLLLGVGGLLVRSMMRFREREEGFGRLQNRLSELYRADVFPSMANVEIERENQVQLDVWFGEVMRQLSQGNSHLTSDERSPSRFVGVLERARENLVQHGQRSRVRLPDANMNFAFGFERYAGTGQLPSPDDVPRLMEQLMIVTRVCRTIFESEVVALQAVRREEFEDAAPLPVQETQAVRRGPTARRGPAEPVVPQTVARRNPGLLADGDMFTTYRFVLEFTAREEALTRVLNSFAASPVYIVVRSVTLRKEVPALVPARSATVGGAAGADRRSAPSAADMNFLFGGEAPRVPEAPAPEEATRDNLLGPSHPVSGIEMEIPMQVRMEIDVYKFRGVDEARR